MFSSSRPPPLQASSFSQLRDERNYYYQLDRTQTVAPQKIVGADGIYISEDVRDRLGIASSELVLIAI